MKKKWNYKLISSKIKKNGYYIFNNYFSHKELNDIKNSLLNTLQYIKQDKERNLQKKYYQIKKFDNKLKGNWYDISAYNLTVLQSLHKPEILDFIKKFYKTKVLFSGRPAIHVHDDDNDKLLDPHQETSQFARDNMVFWSPLFDTNQDNGGMTIYENSHKHGYFKHSLEHPRLGKKSWTKQYTHINPSIAKKFKKVELNVKAGSAVLFLSSLVHCGYSNKKKGTVRITITERFNPLQKIPFLKNRNAPLKMPFVGIDYNKVRD
jgi:hypothetical protein